MKFKNYFLASIAALSLIFTACSKDDGPTNNLEDGIGSISVKLSGTAQSSSLKAASTDDSEIVDYYVYVFGYNSGILEASVAGDPSKTTLISGLNTASTKRVVVLTNLGASNYPKVLNYSDLTKDGYSVNYLDYMNKNTRSGYIMSGEAAGQVVLNPNTTVQAEVEVKRIIAKVTLESIKFTQEEGHDLSKFKLLGVSAQRVTPDVGLAPITPFYLTSGEGAYHYGGISNNNQQLVQTDYLLETQLGLPNTYEYNTDYTIGSTFTVFPNWSEENCTLLTLMGEYDGEVMYYPIKINYVKSTAPVEGGSPADGKFVQSNKHYKLNVTLKKIGDGGENPEVPNEKADLEVVVSIEEWEVIILNEEW